MVLHCIFFAICSPQFYKGFVPTFYEFFAGGGMARIGLGPGWQCTFANDLSSMKAEAYRSNFPDSRSHLVQRDVRAITTADLPGRPELVWGSFPCQDLSLAGVGQGLDGARSGLIWKLLQLVQDLKNERRGPKAIILENVTGLLSSRQGEDIYEIFATLRRSGFAFGALVMDAVAFVPQSRPRIFLVAVETKYASSIAAFSDKAPPIGGLWSSARLERLWKQASPSIRDSWVWWKLPAPPIRQSTIADIIDPDAQTWDSATYTQRLLSLMVPLHLEKVMNASALGTETIGTLYRRTRVIDGERGQRVEVRFDGIAGCLRTPTGGSSRQRLLFVRGSSIRSRLLTPREAARLMGIPDDYCLPHSYNDGYQLAGDGVAVPVVAWLAKNLLDPLLCSSPAVEEKIEPELLYA